MYNLDHRFSLAPRIVIGPAAPDLAAQENRARLSSAVTRPREESDPARSARGAAVHLAITTALARFPVCIDLADCDEDSVHELDIDVVEALVAVLAEPSARITLPGSLRALPDWVFSCSRVTRVNIPDFVGERLDLRPWLTNDGGHKPIVLLEVCNGMSAPRVVVPDHLILDARGEIQLLQDFASPSEHRIHGDLLTRCLPPRLLADLRLEEVAPFVVHDFMRLVVDDNSPLTTVELKAPAVWLVTHYYQERFDTEMQLLCYPDGAVLELDDPEAMNIVQAAVNEARGREPGDEFRLAFICMVNDRHWAPLVYLRERGANGMHHALFYPDSIGPEFHELLDRLATLGLPLFTLDEARQADQGSCATDALVYGRDITARTQLSGGFRLPRLLEVIETGATQHRGYYLVDRLPDVLLKTAQRSAFLRRFPPSDDMPVVHVCSGYLGPNYRIPESIDLFRWRHTEENVPLVRDGEEVTKDVAHYARFKGFQLMRTVQIQYYREAFANVFGDDWDDEADEHFVAAAKAHIHYGQELEIDRGSVDPMDEVL